MDLDWAIFVISYRSLKENEKNEKEKEKEKEKRVRPAFFFGVLVFRFFCSDYGGGGEEGEAWWWW